MDIILWLTLVSVSIDVNIADEDTAPQDFQQVLNAILFP